MEKLTETWKGLKELEFEARRIIVKQVESLEKRATFEKEVVIVDRFPPVKLKCLLFPWLLQCRGNICRMFPWLCWHCWRCPLPCKYCPDPLDRFEVDPLVAIDVIMLHLPDLNPAKITEAAVLKASIAVAEERISIIRQSLDRVSENLKRFK